MARGIKGTVLHTYPAQQSEVSRLPCDNDFAADLRDTRRTDSHYKILEVKRFADRTSHMSLSTLP